MNAPDRYEVSRHRRERVRHSVLGHEAQRSHAELSINITPFRDALQGPGVPPLWSLATETGRIALDADMAGRLMHLFSALNRLGTTVVVATHDVQLLKKVPDSLIMRLDKGRFAGIE
mgnify:CR=1 FL=1